MSTIGQRFMAAVAKSSTPSPSPPPPRLSPEWRATLSSATGSVGRNAARHVGVERTVNERGEREIWLELHILAKLKALRAAGEATAT
jgi:hypothetical protein